MSGSSAKTQSTQQQSTDTQNLNLQDTAGITVANSHGLTINATDQGALTGALDVARDAFDLGQSSLDAGIGVANAGLDNARSAYTGALDFGADLAHDAFDAWDGASDRVARFSTAALATQADANRSALGAVADQTSGVLDFASGLFSQALSANANLTDQNIGAVSALSRQVSQSATQSTNDAVSKVAVYALLAVAAIFVLPALVKGAK